MNEHNNIVCQTGRITRLVDSLTGLDTEIKIMPSYNIREEMMNKSALIRKNIEKKYENRELGEDFDNELKETLRGSLKKDYLDTGILGLARFNEETDWINYL
jgi:hypothetical protein